MLQVPTASRMCDFLRVVAKRNPSAIAIEHDRGRLTYGEFHERSLRCAQALLKQGLSPGDRMVISMRNGPEYLELYMGMQFAGIVAVPVNFRLTAPELAYVYGNCEATGIAIDREFLPTFELAKKEPTPAPEIMIVVDAGTRNNPYERMLADAEPVAPAPSLDPHSASSIFYTSGTTGFPKGVVMSQLGLMTRFFLFGWRWGITEESVVLVPGPIFHQSFGGVALMVLCTGGRLVLHANFDPAHVIETLQQEKITWSFMVPKMHADIVDALKGTCLPGCDQLKGLLSSGSPLAPAVLEGLLEAFPQVRITDAYGWTECGFVTCCRHEDLISGVRTVGAAAFGCEVAILDEVGNELPIGETGQIFASIPVPFLGYYKNPEATASSHIGKWHTGGDVGMLDDQGRLTIFDRKRDMIISGGENVYPAELERVLSDHPKILEVGVIGVPDARWGESPRACVVPRPGQSLSEAEILQFCVGKLAGFKHPRSAVLLDSLPRNSMGKLLRRELRERYCEESKQRV